MVKPIGSSPQPTTVKPDVEQVGVNPQNEEAIRANKPAPIYNAKAQHARRAEHAMSGEAWALKLQQQLDAKNQSPKSGSMVLPRVGWEMKVNQSENNPVPTPYPNIADAKKKDESKK